MLNFFTLNFKSDVYYMISSPAGCGKLEDLGKGVKTKPPLPVSHNTTINFSCSPPARLVGSKSGTCLDGTISTEFTPFCIGVYDLTYFYTYVTSSMCAASIKSI